MSLPPKLAEIPREEMLLRGGWVPGSKVPDVFYTTYDCGGGRGGMAMAVDGPDEGSLSNEPSNLELTWPQAHGGKARPGKRVRDDSGV